MKKVATVLAVATVTMATTMDNLGDDNFMINPFDQYGNRVPIPNRDIRRPVLDRAVAADDFGDDNFAVDDFGDENFMIRPEETKHPRRFEESKQALREKLFGRHPEGRPEARGTHKSPVLGGIKPSKPIKKPMIDKIVAADEFADDNFAVDDFGDDNFALDDFADDNFAAQELGPRKFGIVGPRKPVHEKTEKTEKTGELGPRKYGLVGPRKPIHEKTEKTGELGPRKYGIVGPRKPVHEKTVAADEFADENFAVEFADDEMWSRTDLPLHPVNKDKPRYKIIAHDKVEFDDEFFAADDFGDDNFAVEFGDDEFARMGGPQSGLFKHEKEHTKKPVEKIIAADEFDNEFFAADDFGDDNFAVDDFADENFAVEFGDDEFARMGGPQSGLFKHEKEHTKKPVEKVIAADEFDNEFFAADDFGDDNYMINPFDKNGNRIPLPIRDTRRPGLDRAVFADDFGDDNFAVDLGDDYFAVDDFGDDNFAVDDFGDDNFAVDDFADENFAVEFGDDELVYVQPKLEKPALRGGSLYHLDKLLKEAH